MEVAFPADDKKRVLIDSGAETGGTLDMGRVTAAVKMLGAGCFPVTGQKKEKPLMVYDSNAFVMDDDEEHGDQESVGHG